MMHQTAPAHSTEHKAPIEFLSPEGAKQRARLYILHLKGDIRVNAPKLQEPVREVIRGSCDRAAKAHSAADLAPPGHERALGGLREVDHASGRVEQGITRRRKLYTVPAADEKGAAKMVFESANLLADAGLGEVKARCGGRETPCFGHLKKYTKLPKVNHIRVPPLRLISRLLLMAYAIPACQTTVPLEPEKPLRVRGRSFRHNGEVLVAKGSDSLGRVQDVCRFISPSPVGLGRQERAISFYEQHFQRDLACYFMFIRCFAERHRAGYRDH